MAGQYNLKSPGVKRILQEMKEMQRTESSEFVAEALGSDLFEWHFAIRGPADTEFEGGIYCGRIVLPAEYPFKPPAFMFLTPTGRFEVGTKICLSISQHHPEHWQPSWSIRLALTALIAFMPSKAEGALGSLDYTKEERRALAIKSRSTPPMYGSPERQEVIDRLHAALLEGAPPVPDLVKASSKGRSLQEAEEAKGESAAPPAARPLALCAEDGRGRIANGDEEHARRKEIETRSTRESGGQGPSGRGAGQNGESQATVSNGVKRGIEIEEEVFEGHEGESSGNERSSSIAEEAAKVQEGISNAVDRASTMSAEEGARKRALQKHPLESGVPPAPTSSAVRSHVATSQKRRSSSLEDRALTILAAVLAACIACLLIRKILRYFL
ncbi:ubiquitin-conjugating enzyme [Klebsormidium nitens]|uniref:Ubiquitin-conjugating enzyme n=1 Tax=Klebsormidium nitens TaxID=105231 RepID=A0A1Y1I879_KLENI|nr:ubiquitin-conjugating enzyme [Klebsormidium nitens]|eukprot:GAQ84907.1 ubiquitin-conjugating enzyme [Klebsormidium nitens]